MPPPARPIVPPGCTIRWIGGARSRAAPRPEGSDCAGRLCPGRLLSWLPGEVLIWRRSYDTPPPEIAADSPYPPPALPAPTLDTVGIVFFSELKKILMSGGRNFFLTKGFVLENPQKFSSPHFGRRYFDQISSKMSACGAPKHFLNPPPPPPKKNPQNRPDNPTGKTTITVGLRGGVGSGAIFLRE